MKKIMIIAAEASSAQYAIKLMREFRKKDASIQFFGVGSEAMEKEGFERLGKSEEMAIVGLTEVLKHLGFLKNIFNNLLQKAKAENPDAVILLDYPDFNLRLAAQLKKINLPVYYYISPQIWAWRKSRVHLIKEYCKKVFLLFGFEKKFYDEYRVPNEFVGHPLLEDLDPSLYDKEKIALARSRYGISVNEEVLALMPGSRRGEIERHFEIQLETARALLKKHPQLRLLICVAPTLSKEDLLSKMENFRSPYIILKEDPNYMIAMADYVLVASGTATLMVGLLGKPMAIMYRMSTMSYWLAKMLVRGVKQFGLINLVHGKMIVPEFLQSQANVKDLFETLDQMIADKEKTTELIEELSTTKDLLKIRGSTKHANELVVDSIWADMQES